MVQHFAPVLISVYNRPKHFMECIDSLSRNSIASETPLFVAIDAPSREIDVEPNEQIRKYASVISGFKNVHLFLREKNLGARMNILQAREDIFSKYDRLIMSEDDNVFSPFFLTYINNGLAYYEHNERIFAICGYNYPIPSPHSYQEDIYFAKAFSAWGYGIWRDKFIKVDFKNDLFWSVFVNPSEWCRINKTLGDHLFTHIVAAKVRKQIFGDTAICTHLYKSEMLSVFPVETLVRNNGHDGSGLHCRRLEKNPFLAQTLWSKKTSPTFSTAIPRESKEFKNTLAKYFKVPILKKVACYILYLLIILLHQFPQSSGFENQTLDKT